jgi:hypothetical protein
MMPEKDDILAAAVLLLLVFGVVAVPVIGLGLALGYGLRAVIPGLDIGWAIVAGAVFATGIVDLTARFLLAARVEKRSAEEGDEEEDDDDDEEEEEEGPDEPWVTIPRRSVPPAKSGRRRAKRRR